MSQATLPTTQIFQSVMQQLMIENPNRRTYDRVPWRQAVSVQALDEDFAPVGEEFKAMSSDISRNGLGLISSVKPVSDYLRIEAREAGLAMLAKITHATDIGDDFPQFLLGTELIRDFPDASAPSVQI
ncbi:MAG: hypothetical protein ACE361_01905 [Aureliella sp.]